MPGNEIAVFHEKWPDLLSNTLKSDEFDENFVTRESIRGHFPPGGWAWGPPGSFLNRSRASRTSKIDQNGPSQKSAKI